MDPYEYEAVLRHAGSVKRYPALERLICIALADPLLKEQLLSNALAVVDALQDDLQLSQIERNMVERVSAPVDIYDFANQLHEQAQKHEPS